jgi:diguanylate cyclase (GGDEF)-like protein
MSDPLTPISPLRGLLEVTRLLRAQGELPEVLAAIARTIGESLGYGTVAINLYRPEWDDFNVAVVHGSETAREALAGRVRGGGDWDELLVERFCHRGAYLVPAGAVDWAELGASYVPAGAPASHDGAWDPEDALFVALRRQDGHLLGIVSVDEPVNGLRPTDEQVDLLVTFAEHAALALQGAREAADAVRHKRALHELLAVSAQLTSGTDAEEILRRVCHGIRDALGFQNVCAVVVEDESARILPHASVGWQLAEAELADSYALADIEALLDPAFEREGCFLLPNDEARSRIGATEIAWTSQLNGSGPWAWNRHWLLVPLHDGDGKLMGLIWADDPDDRLLPSDERLQALRIFANDAASSLASGRRVDELRFLADHDPLTRLLNRRAFIEQLDGEVARATRYGRSFGLVIADLDGFKQMNDRFGHAAGDEALQVFSAVLTRALRKPDEAYRIGGDEFAVLLAEASESDARAVVARIQRLLTDAADDRLSALTASFGCASCPDDARDAITLFRLADEALYEAKRSGSGLTFVGYG